jgi:hypothetical protein
VGKLRLRSTNKSLLEEEAKQLFHAHSISIGPATEIKTAREWQRQELQFSASLKSAATAKPLLPLTCLTSPEVPNWWTTVLHLTCDMPQNPEQAELLSELIQCVTRNPHTRESAARSFGTLDGNGDALIHIAARRGNFGERS